MCKRRTLKKKKKKEKDLKDIVSPMVFNSLK